MLQLHIHYCCIAFLHPYRPCPTVRNWLSFLYLFTSSTPALANIQSAPSPIPHPRAQVLAESLPHLCFTIFTYSSLRHTSTASSSHLDSGILCKAITSLWVFPSPWPWTGFWFSLTASLNLEDFWLLVHCPLVLFKAFGREREQGRKKLHPMKSTWHRASISMIKNPGTYVSSTSIYLFRICKPWVLIEYLLWV